MIDAHCASLGIPDHLHQSGRPPVSFEDLRELLFRRFHLLMEADVAACIKFGDMSVNRAALSTPEETLLNDETGGIHESCGVIAFPVSALSGDWPTDGPSGQVHYALSAEHDPMRCNYAHSLVVVLKDGIRLTKIKPTSVKLAMRRALQRHIQIRVPASRQGESLPLSAAE